MKAQFGGFHQKGLTYAETVKTQRKGEGKEQKSEGAHLPFQRRCAILQKEQKIKLVRREGQG